MFVKFHFTIDGPKTNFVVILHLTHIGSRRFENSGTELTCDLSSSANNFNRRVRNVSTVNHCSVRVFVFSVFFHKYYALNLRRISEIVIRYTIAQTPCNKRGNFGRFRVGCRVVRVWYMSRYLYTCTKYIHSSSD